MKKQDVFDSKLEEATKVRTHIQDDLRAKYNELKLMFEMFTRQKGKLLKHVVDMYHYKNGGYPNENSAPKHFELIERFAWMVHFFNMIGFQRQYKEVLEQFGIKIVCDPHYELHVGGGGDEEDEENITPMPDPTDLVTEEALEALQESPEIKKFLPKKTEITVGQALRAFVLACDEIQGAICAQSNVIKKELAPVVEAACEIKKGDFTSSVMVNYHKVTGRVTKKKVTRLKKSLKSKVETGNFNIANAQAEVE
jgi:uncharacterized protein YdhG (YjbR/CyaY superfamily)